LRIIVQRSGANARATPPPREGGREEGGRVGRSKALVPANATKLKHHRREGDDQKDRRKKKRKS